MAPPGLVEDYLTLLAAIGLLAYLLPAAVFHWVFRNAPPESRIQRRGPRPGQIRREVRRSLLCVALFALYGLGLLHAYREGWTALEPDWGALPLWWQPLAFLVAVAAHDTWFYWVHRLMHTKALFRWVHAEHHPSVQPTPWSILSFDLAETVPQFLFFALLAFLVPMHPAVFWLYFAFDGFVNALGHCGHEVVPERQRDLPVLRWTNAVTHHDLHHARFDCNYAQYFNVWDRLCGTFRDRPPAAQNLGNAPKAAARPGVVPGE